jgi:hypothetical protein
MKAIGKKVDWRKIQREYISGVKTIDLIKKYQLNKNTFDTQRKKGNWTELKRKSNREN